MIVVVGCGCDGCVVDEKKVSRGGGSLGIYNAKGGPSFALKYGCFGKKADNSLSIVGWGGSAWKVVLWGNLGESWNERELILSIGDAGVTQPPKSKLSETTSDLDQQLGLD